MKLEAVANMTIVLLFGAIAGLFGVVLYLSGATGFSAVVSAVVLTLFLGLLQWYFSPTIIRWITGARPISKEQAPKIFEMVSRLSKKAGLPKAPVILVVNNPIPNAFAFGRSHSNSNIAIHSGLLKALAPEEVEAVLAHEIGHIKQRDVVIMTIASMIPVLLYYVAIILLSGSSNGENRRGNSLAVFAGGFLARFFGQLLVLWLSRAREYAADEFSAKVSDGRALAKGLVKISYGLREGGTDDSLACLYIGDNTGENANLLAGYLDMDSKTLGEAIRREQATGFIEFLMTHPLTSKRILALKRLEAEPAGEVRSQRGAK
jgi:heat shock protein HtpX